MSRVFRSLAVLSLLATGVAAQERSPWYATFGGGFHAASDSDGPAGSTLSFDGGYSASLGLGRDLLGSQVVRFGVQTELLLNNFDINEDDADAHSLSSQRIQNVSFLVSGIADFKLAPQFGVYVAPGVGLAKLSADGLDQPGPFTLEDDVVAAFQFKAGFKYGLGGNHDVALGYRYLKMDAAEVSSLSSQSFDLDFDEHILEVVLHWGL